MTYRVQEENNTTGAMVGCRHHWVIESARGPVSHGICKVCGLEKDFYNSAPEEYSMRRRAPVAIMEEREEKVESVPIDELEESELAEEEPDTEE